MPSNNIRRRSVLITGCSSGIGRALALRLARKGWRVFASVRRAESAESVREEARQAGLDLATPILDVVDDASVAGAARQVLEETGGTLDALVNNAGYYAFGAIEETTPAELRAVIETNVVGVLRVTRAVLPAMRARRTGTILNLGSVSGRVVVPMAGPYHTSKWALEALSEALRYELVPFGIRVVLFEPGPFATRLHENEVLAAEAQRPDSPYAGTLARYRRKAERIRRGNLGALVARMERSLDARSPALRWPCGPTSVVGTIGRRLAPDGLYEALLRLAFGLKPPRDR